MVISRDRLRRIGVDILGFLLIIAAGLLGPLPGPGGIPLLILGLSLLATNHEWAERWLLEVKQHGVNISDKLFRDSPRVHMMLDLLTIAFITTAVIVASYFTGIFRTAALSLVIVSLFLFFGNRKRWQKIKKRLFNRNR
jgi:hypothetical protein